jgi:glycosyltransferase involved in cell wall biosynthesis
MNLMPKDESTLISVIITCYNQGKFLAKAINSVLSQEQVEFEIIVVDDGSTDNTKRVAESFPQVKYLYQKNLGLSAARNTGINQSSGAFLVFLDADDWLLSDGLRINLKYIKANPQAAFVSGSYRRVIKDERTINVKISVTECHYQYLLESNYIQMHGAVMYRRRVFDEFRFDISLKACEDYDLYLKVAWKYPVFHHTTPIAAYYQHGENMSGNVPMMLDAYLEVLERQKAFLNSPEEEESLKKGEAYIKMIYCATLYQQLVSRFDSPDNENRPDEIQMLKKHKKLLFLKYVLKKHTPITKIKRLLVKNAPRAVLRGLQKSGIYKNYVPFPGDLNFGDFNRLMPLSEDFGYSRGGPIDRYYIENFLERESNQIRGRILEIGDNEYTTRYGGERVTRSDILHIDETNGKATFYGDLSNAPQLPDDSFDCIILTQTLHLIYECKNAIKTCYRILKPGGTLLMTVPGISQIDRGEWSENWFWSFTEKAIRRLTAEFFPFENISIESFGNVMTAAAFLYGVGLPEIKKEQLDYHDPQYQLIVTVSARKPPNV